MDVDPAINVWLERDGVVRHFEVRATRNPRRFVWVDAQEVSGDIELLDYAAALALRARLERLIADLLEDGWLPAN